MRNVARGDAEIVRPGWVVRFVVLFDAAVVACAATAVALLVPDVAREVVVAVAVAMVVVVVVRSWRVRAELADGCIVVHNLWSTRTLRRDDVVRLYERPLRGSGPVILVAERRGTSRMSRRVAIEATCSTRTADAASNRDRVRAALAAA